MKPLDSEYRKRYQEYYLEDGTIEDSRKKNWRDVDWESVSKIITYINNKTHVTEVKSDEFVCYMCFRWGGREAIYNKKKEFQKHKPINIWTVGWTDGKNHYLTDIDFYAGDIIKEYSIPFNEHQSHIHPSISIKGRK